MSCCPHNSEMQSDSTVYNYMYSPLKNLTKYKCNVPCLCRWDKDRSNFDKMQYAWMIKGKIPHIPPAPNQKNPQTCCGMGRK